MSQIDVLQQLLETDKSNASVWYLLGLEYIQENMTSQALEALSYALQFGDDDLKQKVIVQLQTLSSPASAGDKRSLPEKVPVGDASRLGQAGDPGNDEPHEVGAMRVITGGREDGKVVVLEKRDLTFDDVGGLDEVKDAIRMKIIKPFISAGLFERFQKKVGGGILLYGPPGCGKTFMAKATAGECKATFVGVHITDILDPYVGVSEQQMHEMFASARAKTPCILFFDEVDALGYHRGKSASHLLRGVIDQLLTELDGLDTGTDQILVLGATNMPWDVDPAFKRPGRFDKMLFVPPPDFEARKVIFHLKLREKPTEAIDYDLLAKMTDLYSGADIDNVVETATERVISEIMRTGVERPLRTSDVRAAIGTTVPSTMEWLRTVKTYVKYSNQSRQYDDVQAFLSRHKQI